MKLKTDDLYLLQNTLDSRIFTLHHVTREGTRQARLLALLTEVGEMINETRCFKYWSEKAPSPLPVVLEEYGDGIHFLLSLGIDLNDQSTVISSSEPATDMITQALNVYREISLLQENFTIEQYQRTFASFLAIGELAGFQAEDIRTYYLLKNQKNHQRQDNHY